eukprot:1910119-Prorocentrum_lima.AAC.1
MLWTENDEAPTKFFTAETLLAGRGTFKKIDGDSSEMCRRPQVGVSVACGTAATGLQVLDLLPPADGVGEEQRRAYGKTGLAAAKEEWTQEL